MYGLKYDFEAGDIAIDAGTEQLSTAVIDNQNVALIALSQVCRLTKPEYGAQIGSRIVNRRLDSVNSILADAKRQAEKDGAIDVEIRFTQDEQLIFVGTYEN